MSLSEAVEPKIDLTDSIDELLARKVERMSCCFKVSAIIFVSAIPWLTGF